MKKMTSVLLVLALWACLCLNVCPAEGAPAIAFDLSALTIREADADGETVQEIVLFKGKTAKLAVVLPQAENAKKIKLRWHSSDTKVATVANGTVTAKNGGTAVITCEATDGTGLKAACVVDVYAAVKRAAMAAPKASVLMETAGTQLSLALKPEGASYYGVSWSSSDESVAKVDENGLVSPVKGGKATITAQITNLLDPNAKKQVGWWDQLGFRLMSASGFRVYLTGVQYGDGSWDFFFEDNLIGWF